MKQVWQAHQPQRKGAVHRLAKAKRLQYPISQPQVLRVWKKRSWSSEMQSHTKTLSSPPLISWMHRNERLNKQILGTHFQSWCMISEAVLMLESPKSTTLSHQSTRLQFTRPQINLTKLLMQSFPRDSTWAHSPESRSRASWVLSSCHCSASSQSQTSQANTDSSKIYHTHIL